MRSHSPPASASPAGHSDDLPHRETLEQAVGTLARRYRLCSEDAEEFAAEVALRMVEQGDVILGKFEGRSSLTTYLFTVVNSVFWEWRNKRFGRWRPSVAATRLGPVALHLEELTVRDGMAFAEAVTILRENHGCTLTEAELEAMVLQLPARHRLVEVTDDSLVQTPASEPDPEAELLERESRMQGSQVRQIIHALLGRLSAEDQLVMKLHFFGDVKLVNVAQSLGIQPKVLYRRVEKLLKNMGKQLAVKGIAHKNHQALLEALRLAVLHEPEETQPWLSKKVSAAERGTHAR